MSRSLHNIHSQAHVGLAIREVSGVVRAGSDGLRSYRVLQSFFQVITAGAQCGHLFCQLLEQQGETGF